MAPNVQTFDELKEYLKPGTIFYVLSPTIIEGVPVKRKVQMLDATGIHYTDPSHPPPPTCPWNGGKMFWGEPKDFYFAPGEFAWVWRGKDGNIAGAFRCAFADPTAVEQQQPAEAVAV